MDIRYLKFKFIPNIHYPISFTEYPIPMLIGQAATYKKTFTQEEFDHFARLSGDDNPIHVDPQFSARTKFGKTVAHGMLLYSTIGRCLGAQLPGSGSLQLYQELVFPNPTFVDQPVTFKLQVTALPSPNTVEITTDVIQPDGKLGCTGKTRVCLPGEKPNAHQRAATHKSYKSEASEHRGLKIGQRATSTRRFTHREIAEFCDLVKEKNELYTDSGYAHTKHFKDILIPGGLLGGSVSDLLGTELPGKGTNWLRQIYHFLAPAYPGDEIATTVEIVRLRPEKDLVNVRTTLTNLDDQVVVDGEALVWVSDLVETSII